MPNDKLVDDPNAYHRLERRLRGFRQPAPLRKKEVEHVACHVNSANVVLVPRPLALPGVVLQQNPLWNSSTKIGLPFVFWNTRSDSGSHSSRNVPSVS